MSKITNFIKAPPLITYILTIITTLLLFANNAFLKQFTLLDFKNEYYLYIAVVFVLSLGFSIINVRKLILKIRQGYKKIQVYQTNIKVLMQHLNEMEKSVLREFKIQEEDIITVSMEDATVLQLVKNNILQQDSTIIAQKNIAGKTCKVKISNLAKKSLTDSLIDYPKNTERPAWISIIEIQKEYDDKMAELMNA